MVISPHWHTGLMNEESTAATSGETRAELTRLSARGYAQIRHVLVQLPDEKKPRASSIARFMSERKHRALLLYLLLLTCWPWLKDRRSPLESNVWVRALQSDLPNAPTWSASTLSRAWADLEEMQLITREREGRLLRVVPRREDAGADYEAPGGRKDRWNAYFALPDEFWNKEIFAQLKLPGLVMLLLLAKETSYQSEVWLTYENAEKWYGIKPKSAQNGLAELERLALVHRRPEKIKAPLSPTGSTVRMHYSLTGAFGHKARQALQARAAAKVQQRQKNQKKAVSFNPGKKKT